jgi:hypothetical protein
MKNPSEAVSSGGGERASILRDLGGVLLASSNRATVAAKGGRDLGFEHDRGHGHG